MSMPKDYLHIFGGSLVNLMVLNNPEAVRVHSSSDFFFFRNDLNVHEKSAESRLLKQPVNFGLCEDTSQQIQCYNERPPLPAKAMS